MAGVCVCVGVSGPQPSLVTSVSRCDAKPTRTNSRTERANRDKQPKRKTNQTRNKAKPTKRGSQQNQPEQKAARRAEPKKEEKGRGEKMASGGQQKRKKWGPEAFGGNRRLYTAAPPAADPPPVHDYRCNLQCILHVVFKKHRFLQGFVAFAVSRFHLGDVKKPWVFHGFGS